MSKMETHARIVGTSYKMLFLILEIEGHKFCNYEHANASFRDFTLLCTSILCDQTDYVGVVDTLAKMINNYKTKVLPELSNISPSVEYYAHNVLHCMHKMHRYILDLMS